MTVKCQFIWIAETDHKKSRTALPYINLNKLRTLNVNLFEKSLIVCF